MRPSFFTMTVHCSTGLAAPSTAARQTVFAATILAFRFSRDAGDDANGASEGKVPHSGQAVVSTAVGLATLHMIEHWYTPSHHSPGKLTAQHSSAPPAGVLERQAVALGLLNWSGGA